MKHSILLRNISITSGLRTTDANPISNVANGYNGIKKQPTSEKKNIMLVYIHKAYARARHIHMVLTRRLSSTAEPTTVLVANVTVCSVPPCPFHSTRALPALYSPLYVHIRTLMYENNRGISLQSQHTSGARISRL